MNKVNFQEQPVPEAQVGSIWKYKEEEEDYYILSRISNTEYVYICLNDGYSWDKPFTDINDTQGLAFVTNSANITITPI